MSKRNRDRRISEGTDYSYTEKHEQKEGTGELINVGQAHSSGGHTCGNGVRKTNKRRIFQIDHATQEADVYAGAQWFDLLDEGIVPASCQSYADFEIAAAVSVNAHGPFHCCRPVGQTVKALHVTGEKKVLTPDDEKFWHVVGGYGLVESILRVQLETQPNVALEDAYTLTNADSILMTIPDSATLWSSHLSADWTQAFTHAAYPKGEVIEEYVEPDFWLERVVFEYASHSVRWLIEKAAARNSGQSLARRFARTNWFEPIFPWQYSYLMEFFIPIEFAPYWQEAVRDLDLLPMGIRNTTVRHTAADPRPVLSYSPTESLAYVMYGRVPKSQLAAGSELASQSEKLVDLCLDFQGKFYLPYRPHFTLDQFQKAYDRWGDLQVDKRRRSRFSERYLAGLYT